MVKIKFNQQGYETIEVMQKDEDPIPLRGDLVRLPAGSDGGFMYGEIVEVKYIYHRHHMIKINDILLGHIQITLGG